MSQIHQTAAQNCDAHVLMSAFSVFVRPLLEYSSVIWSPFTKTEIGRIESVQRRFTKCIQSIKSCSYRERLIKLGIDSLYCRRLKFDLTLIPRDILLHPHILQRGKITSISCLSLALFRAVMQISFQIE